MDEDAGTATLTLPPEMALSLLAEKAVALAEQAGGRVALGIAGGPGVGKSTLAAQLVAALNGGRPDRAALVPMDGFHMRQEKLETLGLTAEKGAPRTFEATEFAAFVVRLKQATGTVTGPGYSRQIEDVVDDAVTVPAEARILIVEGNYLLLTEGPWAEVKPALDFTVFIDVPRDVVRARLLKRHAAEGLFTEERNIAHVDRVDLGNYDLVAATRARADLVLALATDS